MGDSQEAAFFCRRYVNMVFGSCTVLWAVLVLAAGYGPEDYPGLVGFFLVWGVVWCVDALVLPGLFSAHLRYLLTYGNKAKARILRKHRVLTLGIPVVSVELLGVQSPKPGPVWCLAMPSQFMKCRAGDEVDVVYVPGGGSRSAVRACLSAQLGGTARPSQRKEDGALLAAGDVKARIGEVLSALDGSLRALRTVGWGSAVLFAIVTFVLLPRLLSGSWLGLVLWAFGYLALVVAMNVAWVRMAIHKAKQRFDKEFATGSPDRGEAVRLLAQADDCGLTPRLLAAELSRTGLDAREG